MKRLATTFKMFIFTVNWRANRHVYMTMSNSRVARSVLKFLPNCLQKLAQRAINFWLVCVGQMAEYIKQQVLEFESHLAAATSKQQITESTSLLISQLTRMEPTYVDIRWCHWRWHWSGWPQFLESPWKSIHFPRTWKFFENRRNCCSTHTPI